MGLAALAGGTVHGFFLDVNSTGFAILWPISLIAIGVAALSAWGIGAVLQFSEPVARLIILVASVVFTGYCAMVLFVTQNFLIAIVHYLPAAIFLLFVLSTQYVQSREWGILIGVIGLALIFIASFIQQLGISLHPVYFNHNALYHFIIAVALFMIFRTARWFVVARSTQMR